MSANNWTTIGDIADVYDGPHATPEKIENGPIFLGITSLNKGSLDLEASAHISEEDFVKWTRRVTPQADDVVFSYETRLGEAAIIPKGLRCCLGRRMGLLRAKKGKVLPEFLLYAYLSPEFQASIKARTVPGSTVDRIALKDLPNFPVRIPSIEEQAYTILILKALDDKIALNRQINQTLEAMAQALFKSWFVDFEPVRAKVAALELGEDPTRAAMRAISGKTDAELNAFQTTDAVAYNQLYATASLFPDEFEQSELGLVPKGWEVSTLGQTFKVTMGQSPSGETYNELGQGLPFYQGRTDFGFRFPERRIYCSEPTRLAQEGETLLSVRAPVGDLNLAIEKCCIGRGVAALIHDSNSTSYSYYLMSVLKPKFDSFNAEGTVFGSINQKDLKAVKYTNPSYHLTHLFDLTCKSFDQDIKVNSEQIQTLSTLRDTLLPKLLSGELSVTNSEVEAVAIG